MTDSYRPEQPELSAWQEAAERQLKGKPLDVLTWKTAEGIDVKPLYTAADLEALQFANTLPGIEPFVRGPQPTMYAGRPWTIRQYAGFSTAEESNEFYPGPWRPAGRGCRWPSTWPPTGAMTPITPGSLGMWARPGWPSIPPRT